MHQHAKNYSIPSIHSWDTTNFRVLWPDWPHLFLRTPTPKFFDQLLIFVILYLHAKNQAISLICSEDMVDWKILQSEWLRRFWPISRELKFSQIWNLSRNTANNTSFHYRTNSVKINDKNFSINSKNHAFGPFMVHFSGFWCKNFFLENKALSHTTSYGSLAPCQILEKTNDAIPRKRQKRRKDRRTDGRTHGRTGRP